MNDLVDVVGLRPLLDSAGIDNDCGDFESNYSALVTEGTREELVSELESKVFDYFATLELPDEPTLYDHLVLSLREKDIVATFNWDPFLMQAIARNQHVAPVPHALHLHGNVSIGYCMKHMPIHAGRRGNICPRCHSTLTNTPLLYPVTHKNYQTDPFIAKSWQLIQQELNAGYLLTIFGYGAPKTDVEAVELLNGAWGAEHSEQYKTVEIVDIRSEDELIMTWRPFAQSHYYGVVNDFYESNLGQFPRRSCESIFFMEMNGELTTPKVIPRNAGWEELHAWFSPLIDVEQTPSVQP